MKTKRYFWYVNTGPYHKPLKILAKNMTEAKEMAYLLLIQMNFKNFNEYVSLDVSGSKLF
jgi:hypothetical protein